MSVLTDTRRAERARAIDNALASVRMEGLEPSEEGKAIMQRYVDGEITIEEMGDAIDKYFDAKYGPVRLSRNDAS